MPTLAAGAYRFSVGMPFVYPDNSLDFCANFLSMMWKIAEPRYDANPVLARALDVLFILHADHEQNCGDRHAHGRLGARRSVLGHGGGDRSALRTPPRRRQRGRAQDAHRDRLLRERSGVHRPGEGREGASGFGHRVYKNYDPAPRSSRRPPTPSSRSRARTRCSTSR
jgi:citrate synthase